MWKNNVVRYTVVGVGVVVGTYCLAHGVRLVKRLYVQYATKVTDVVDRAPAETPAVDVVDPDDTEVLWTNEKTTHCLVGDQCSSIRSKGDCGNRYCPIKNIHRMMELLENAQYTLDIAVYTITSCEVLDTLLKALNRNVRIRIITDKEMVSSSGSRIRPLMVEGVPVRYQLSAALMHHKFCIIDGAHRVRQAFDGTVPETALKSRLLCGSQNWTSTGFFNNYENVLVTSNKHLVAEYETEFERIWNSDAFNLGLPDIKVKRNGDNAQIIRIQ